MRRLIISTVATLVSIAFLQNTVLAQKTYTDKTAGFSVSVPNDWSQEGFETGQTAFQSFSPDTTGIFSVGLHTFKEGQSSKDYLIWMESYMPDAGYSENFMPEESRSITGTDAAFYNADEIYCGAYKKTKNGVEMVQMIFILKSGKYGYSMIETCPLENLTAMQPFFDVFLNSFKILE